MLGYYRERFRLKNDDFLGARDFTGNTLITPFQSKIFEEDCNYGALTIIKLF